MHGHGIEHFVGKHQSLEFLRQSLQPEHSFKELWRVPFKQLPLPLLKIATNFQNEITIRQDAEFFQFEQQVERKFSSARPELKNVAPGELKNLCDLTGQGSAKQSGDFGSSHKIARLPEFHGPATVISEAGSVQSQFHVAFEGNPAARSSDFRRDQLTQHVTVRKSGFLRLR